MVTSTNFGAVDTKILLEAGTNEAEVLVFRVRNQRYGVNVAKVREVLPIDSCTFMPMSHAAIDGLVVIRELIVPLVNLNRYLYGENGEEREMTEDNLLLLEFNRQHIAFRVQDVDRIYRITWRDTLPAPQLGSNASPITSIWRLDPGIVPLIDFEAITATIGIGGQNTTIGSSLRDDSIDRSEVPIVFADDSVLISEMIKDALVDAGFTNLKGFGDGDELWDYLENLTRDLSPDEVKQHLAGVITDVEMPRMDGLSLTKRIRSHAPTAELPVIIYSSIASIDNEKKGLQVGATAQVAKPRYDDLVTTVAEVFQYDRIRETGLRTSHTGDPV